MLKQSLQQALKAVLLASGHRFQFLGKVLPIQERGLRRSQSPRLIDQPIVIIEPYVRQE